MNYPLHRGSHWLFCSLTLLLHITLCQSVLAVNWPLKASSNARYLVDQDDVPFLIQGSSGWSLPVQLSTNQAKLYLDDRATKDFSAEIWRITDKYYGDNAPANYYGQQPFLTPGDFSTPNDDYFRTLDWFLNYARNRGIVVFATPLYLGNTDAHGWAQEVVANGPEKCRAFGEYLGSRYRDFGNIIWVVGGDRNPSSAQLASLNAFAEGILTFDDQHIFTAYAMQSEARVRYSTDWLALNNVYTYADALYTEIYTAYNRTPSMPVFLIEATFEGEYNSVPLELRSQAWWAVLSGGSGHFFGNYYIWRFRSGWQNALDSPGNLSMAHLARLMKSRPWWKLQPDQSHDVVVSGVGSGTSYAAAAVASDGSSLVAYLPAPTTVSVDMSRIGGSVATAWWFNPREGNAIPIASSSTTGTRSFTSPDSNDWVLVVDDASLNLSAPGLVGTPPMPPTNLRVIVQQP